MPNPWIQNSTVSIDKIPTEGSSAFLLQAAPKLPKSALTHVQQYHISSEASLGITTLIQDLERQGIIQKTHSPYNYPVWPVHKPNGTWHLTVDYRKLNENTGPLHAAVPSITDLVFTIEQAARPWMAVLDVKDTLSMVPLQPEDQERFAFTQGATQYTFTRLPQGFKHSPTLSH